MAEHLPPMDVAGLTDAGLKRSRNEDSFTVLVPRPDSEQERGGAVFIVADGMGGMGGGDVASQAAIAEFTRVYYAPDAAAADPLARLQSALAPANPHVREQAQTVGLARIGATAAGLAILPSGTALIFNVGDSRVYHIRGSYVELLSRDQSVLAHQLEQGLITHEEARRSRNVNVTAFIGQPTTIQPNYNQIEPQQGDVFILCSDGLWDLVETHEILDAIRNSPAKSAARKLVALARRRGAPDNVTVIIVRLGSAPRSRSLLGLGVLALLIALLILGALALWNRNPAAPPTQTALAAAEETDAVLVAVSVATEEMSPTGASVVSVLSETPLPTETRRPTATRTPTPRPSLTATVQAVVAPTKPTSTLVARASTATATRMPTLSPTPTLTRTPRPTPTPSPTVTATERPTSTPSLTPRPTASATSRAAAANPTVTLNPALATRTPQPGVPPEARAALLLQAAGDDGVVLSAKAPLYVLSPVGAPVPEVMDTLDIEAGTTVHLVDEVVRTHPESESTLLRHVQILDGALEGEQGWISVSTLEQAEPLTPRVMVNPEQAQSANVRRGAGAGFERVGSLNAGESARVLGVNSSAGWYFIELPGGARGWVSSGVLLLAGSLSGVPRLTPPTPDTPPTPEDFEFGAGAALPDGTEPVAP